jgi:uncharacterized membrane protein
MRNNKLKNIVLALTAFVLAETIMCPSEAQQLIQCGGFWYGGSFLESCDYKCSTPQGGYTILDIFCAGGEGDNLFVPGPMCGGTGTPQNPIFLQNCDGNIQCDTGSCSSGSPGRPKAPAKSLPPTKPADLPAKPLEKKQELKHVLGPKPNP